MAAKKTGISLDLIIHPGETIADLLDERGISQADLAARTGVSTAYVSNVISGKKDISKKFAMALEYALGVPKTFWLNLQANYDAELLEANQELTITNEEKYACKALSEVVEHLQKRNIIPISQRIEETILSLRKFLQISSIENLKNLVPQGAFRMAHKATVNPHVMGAWLRICHIIGEKSPVIPSFDPKKIDNLVDEIKKIMLKTTCDIQKELITVMQQYGIHFSVVKNFKGAPVHGYISQKADGTYQMVLTIRGSFADIFWFSLFHELGHIVNGDVSKGSKYIDTADNENVEQEYAADLFASNKLLSNASYKHFTQLKDFSISAIKQYAKAQNVMPYIVIGRLQKDGYIPYTWYSEYKLRYKWAENA